MTKKLARGDGPLIRVPSAGDGRWQGPAPITSHHIKATLGQIGFPPGVDSGHPGAEVPTAEDGEHPVSSRSTPPPSGILLCVTPLAESLSGGFQESLLAVLTHRQCVKSKCVQKILML